MDNAVRQARLKKTGFPKFTFEATSNTYGTFHQMKVPSDVHMLWENYGTKTPEIVDRLSVILVGNTTPPDLSEYSDSVKTIVFTGHIGCTKTALQMVHQLKACTEVQFHLGSKEQLPYLLQKEKHAIIPVKTVKTLGLNMKLGNPDKDLKEVVDIQLKTLLNDCITAFPLVETFTTDLPPEGCYFDLLKETLPEFKNLKYKFIPEIKDNKISVVCRPMQAVKIVEKPQPKASKTQILVSQSHQITNKRKPSQSIPEPQIEKRPKVNNQSTEKRNYEKHFNSKRHTGNNESRQDKIYYEDKPPQNYKKECHGKSHQRISAGPNRNPFERNHHPDYSSSNFSKGGSEFKKLKKEFGEDDRCDYYHDQNPFRNNDAPPYHQQSLEMNFHNREPTDSDKRRQQQAFTHNGEINHINPASSQSALLTSVAFSENDSNIKDEEEYLEDEDEMGDWSEGEEIWEEEEEEEEEKPADILEPEKFKELYDRRPCGDASPLQKSEEFDAFLKEGGIIRMDLSFNTINIVKELLASQNQTRPP